MAQTPSVRFPLSHNTCSRQPARRYLTCFNTSFCLLLPISLPNRLPLHWNFIQRWQVEVSRGTPFPGGSTVVRPELSFRFILCDLLISTAGTAWSQQAISCCLSCLQETIVLWIIMIIRRPFRSQTKARFLTRSMTRTHCSTKTSAPKRVRKVCPKPSSALWLLTIRCFH